MTTSTWQNRHTFTISCDGTKTGEKWTGAFACKILMSHEDEMAADRRRRELLGEHSESVPEENLKRAVIFSELGVRLIEAPAWWTTARNGVALLDNEPVIAVYNECVRVETEHFAKLAAKAAEAQARLRAEAEASAANALAEPPKPLGQ